MNYDNPLTIDTQASDAYNSGLTGFALKTVPLTVASAVTSLYRIPSDLYTFATKKEGYWTDLDASLLAQKMSSSTGVDFTTAYDRQSEGINLAGNIVAGFVPGTAAIKFGNMAVKGIMTTERVAAATGITSGGFRAQQLDLARKAIEGGTSATINKWAYAAATGGQVAFDTALFEAGAQLVNYQSPSFADKSAGEIFTHTMTASAIFGGLGVGVGRLIAGSRKLGDTGLTLNKVEEAVNAAKLEGGARTVITDATPNATAGDKLVANLAGVAQPKITSYYGEIADAASVRANKLLSTKAQEHLISLVKEKGTDLEPLFKQVASQTDEVRAAIFGGMESLRKIEPGIGIAENELLVNVAKNLSAETLPYSATLVDKGIKIISGNHTIVHANGKVESFASLLTDSSLDSMRKVSPEAIDAARSYKQGIQNAAEGISPVAPTDFLGMEAQYFKAGKILTSDGMALEGAEATQFMLNSKKRMGEALAAEGKNMEEIQRTLSSKYDHATDTFEAYTHIDQTVQEWYVAGYAKKTDTVWNQKSLASWMTEQNLLALDNKNKVAALMQEIGINAAVLPDSINPMSVAAYQRTSSGAVNFADGAYKSSMSYAQAIGAVVKTTADEVVKFTKVGFINSSQALTTIGDKASVAVGAVANSIVTNPLKYVVSKNKAGEIVIESVELVEYNSLKHATSRAAQNRKFKLEEIIAKQENMGVLLDAKMPYAKEVGEYFLKHSEHLVPAINKERRLDAIQHGRPYEELPAGILYFPPKTTDFAQKYVGFAKNANGELRTVVGKTAQEYNELKEAIAKLDETVSFVDNTEVVAFKKLRGEYESGSAIRNAYYNSAMHSKGRLNEFVPDTTFEAMVRAEQWRSRLDTSTVRRTIEVHYSKDIAELDFMHNLANPTSIIEKVSKEGKIIDFVKSQANEVETAFSELKRTMLNVNKINSNPLWENISNGSGRLLDWGIEKSAEALKAVRENRLDYTDLSKILEKYGYKDAHMNEELWKMTGYKSYDGTTQSIVQKARAAVTTATLRFGEFANIVTQLQGQLITLIPQTKSALGAYGVDSKVASAVADGLKDAWTSSGKARTALFEAAGPAWISPKERAYTEALEEISLIGALPTAVDKTSIWNRVKSATSTLIELGSKPVDMMERNTRLTALHTAANVLEKSGIAAGTPEWYAGTLAFANKVNGNFIASQRPTIFSGTLGQTISLFQGYQINLMQQMFTHIAEGETKQIAMMLAAQNTLFGLSSQPLFKTINEKLIGNYLPNHEDAFTASANAAKLGDTLMYGVGSNLLGAALWSRGDTNPRYTSIISLDPRDSAVWQTAQKAVVGVKDLTLAAVGPDKFNHGLTAIAHANISRPLTGLAETLLGKRVSGGNELDMNVDNPFTGTTDLGTVWNMGVRMIGAKPLDEALVMDNFYRAKQYQVIDRKIKLDIAKNVKEDIITNPNKELDPEALDDYARKYMQAGGSREGFNRVLQNAIKTSDTTRAERFIEKNKNSAYSQTLQWYLDGKHEIWENPTNPQSK